VGDEPDLDALVRARPQSALVEERCPCVHEVVEHGQLEIAGRDLQERHPAGRQQSPDQAFVEVTEHGRSEDPRLARRVPGCGVEAREVLERLPTALGR
jgi:hypothetical protein